MNNNFVAINKNIINDKKYEYGKLECLRGWKRFATRKTRKRLGVELQALEEGQAADVLTPEATGAVSTNSQYIDKNNYASYAGQVNTINQMYNNETEYGSEFLRALIGTRVSFVAGAGISVLATRDDKESEQVTEWVKSFYKINKYFGSRFLEDVLISEMEGKCLLVIMSDVKDKNIRLRSYMWYKTHYNVEMKDKDNQEIKKVTYQKNQVDTTEIAKPEDLIYIKIGGTPDRVNLTIPKVANNLTDIENISRSKYDLRKNNHLFGRTTPYFKTKDQNEAKALTEKIKGIVWKIGKAFAGNAEFSLVEPSGRASESLKEEITLGMKIISLNMNIPVHYLAYPELLSNRSTAETLVEVINAGTIQERTKWEEGVKEAADKAMEMAFSRGWCPYNDPDAYEIRIDLATYANLKQIIEVWYPLLLDDVIDMGTFRSMLPGIDPQRVKQLVEEQKQENMERFNEGLGEETEEEEIEEEEVEEKIE